MTKSNLSISTPNFANINGTCPLRMSLVILGVRSSRQRCSIKKSVVKIFAIFTGKHCEYCKIFENTYFEEHLRTSASVHNLREYCTILSIFLSNSIIVLLHFWWVVANNFDVFSALLTRL